MIAVAFYLALLRFLQSRARLPEIAFGGYIWCAIAAVAASFFAEGASYLFTWPSLTAAVSFSALTFLSVGMTSQLSTAVQLICAVPACYFLPWLIKTAFLGFGMAAIIPMMLISALLFPFIASMLAPLKSPRWIQLALGVAAVSLCAGTVCNRVTRQHPRQESIFYALNLDSGEAYWGKFDRGSNEWTRRVFAGEPSPQPLSPFYPGHASFMGVRSPRVALPVPTVDIMRDQVSESVRTVQLVIRLPSGWSDMVIYSPGAQAVQLNRLQIGGVNRGNGPLQFMSLSAHNIPSDGLILELDLRADQKIDLRVSAYGTVFPPGFAEILHEYPSTMTRSQVGSMFNNTTIISQSIPL